MDSKEAYHATIVVIVVVVVVVAVVMIVIVVVVMVLIMVFPLRIRAVVVLNCTVLPIIFSPDLERNIDTQEIVIRRPASVSRERRPRRNGGM